MTDRFTQLPARAAWRHRDAREGFEVVFARAAAGGYRIDGATAALEGDDAWCVSYDIALDAGWGTRRAEVSGTSAAGRADVVLESDGAGEWLVDGRPAAHLRGCRDVDLESSALTNAFPVHRLGLEVGESADAPAAYVRALDLRVERLEQHYVRLENDGVRERYHYAAPIFDFECELIYDEAGLLLDYPGIASRAG